jgi:hypothetical protein
MRKREIEKLLERAVAEALGVELKPARRKSVGVVAKKAQPEHRAAA